MEKTRGREENPPDRKRKKLPLEGSFFLGGKKKKPLDEADREVKKRREKDINGRNKNPTLLS